MQRMKNFRHIVLPWGNPLMNCITSDILHLHLILAVVLVFQLSHSLVTILHIHTGNYFLLWRNNISCSHCLLFLIFSNLCCSITAEDVERYFVAIAVITKLCYQDSALLILSEFVRNVHTQPNVKKNSLEDTWRLCVLVSTNYFIKKYWLSSQFFKVLFARIFL